jgi:peroxiredoxin
MHIVRKFKVLLLTVSISLVLGLGKSALAREIILKDLAGQSVNISNYKGKPVILFFWTTWCPFCRKELQILNKEYAAIAQAGIVVLGVNESEAEQKVQKFFKGYTLNFEMLLDRSGSLGNKYDVLGVPTYIFLDRSGEVISVAHNLPDDYKRLLLSN